jgi:hypothetical protein
VSAFIETQRAAGFAVELVCRTLGVSGSAHYQRATGQRSARAVGDEQLLAMIQQLHKDNFEAYGYRKLQLALRRRGIEVGRDRVKRLMRAHGIQGAKRRGKRWKTTTPDAQAGRRPDLVERDFTASRPDELYVADFTYLRCWQGLVFLAFVIDVYSRRVVGWQLASHMRASLVCARFGWPSAPASVAPTWRSCTIPIADRNPDSTGGRNSCPCGEPYRDGDGRSPACAGAW